MSAATVCSHNWVMRTASIVINGMVAVFFGCFLAYTFIARNHLDSLARGFVTDKTLEYSQPLFEVAEAAIDSPLVGDILSAEQLEAFSEEVSDYGKEPAAYIRDLTGQGVDDLDDLMLGGKVGAIKREIRKFYDDTLGKLIRDLRIFAASNLIAACLGLTFAYRNVGKIQNSLVVFSLLMSVGVVYCSILYLDRLTFFRILFGFQLGWYYPLVLTAVIAGLYKDFGKQAENLVSHIEPSRCEPDEDSVRS